MPLVCHRIKMYGVAMLPYSTFNNFCFSSLTQLAGHCKKKEKFRCYCYRIKAKVSDDFVPFCMCHLTHMALYNFGQEAYIVFLLLYFNPLK